MNTVEFPIKVDGEVRVFRADGSIEVHKSKEIKEEEFDEDVKLFMLLRCVKNTFKNTSLILDKYKRKG